MNLPHAALFNDDPAAGGGGTAVAPAPAPAPTPAPAPAAPASPGSGSGVPDRWEKGWIKSDFSLDHSALDRLPDHLKGLRPTLERQKSFEDVLTVMQNQQVLAGKKALAPLPADAPEHVRAERKALLDTINGVPPTAKDYGLAKPQDLPAEQWNQPLADAFTAWAHKHSVPPAAAKELLAVQVQAIKGQAAEQAQYVQQFFAQQQQVFEGAIRQANIPLDRANALAEKGALALGLDMSKPEVQDLMKNANVRLMAMRHAIATGEDRAVGPDSKGNAGQDPEAEANDIVHNKANPHYELYWNREGKFPQAQSQSVRDRVNELYRQAATKGKK